MKSSISAAILFSLALLGAGTIFAQTTATTDPVGFITLNVAGTGGTTPTALSFVGLGMTQAVEYQGIADTVGTNSVTSNAATWSDNQFNAPNGAYFLEITSGTGAGTVYDITATTASSKTITLAQNLAAGVAGGAAFKVRKHWTIAAVFGANDESGLGGGSGANVADQILLWNGTGYDIYYFKTSGLGGTGWRSTASNSADASGTVIFQEEGVIINRRQSAALPVTLMGSVKLGQTSVPVANGLNFVGNVYASGLTLGDCGIYTANSTTGLAGGSGSNVADQILLWNGTGYDIYYFKTSGLGGTGWRSSASNSADASGTPVAVGQSIIVNRKAPGGFSWVIPQHPSSL